MTTDKEHAERIALRVVAVAVRCDGVVYSLPPPHRHHHVLWMINARREHDDQGSWLDGQGFLLSDGRFARRMPALHIARRAGQTIRETAPQHGLFSEDVW